MMSRTWRTLAEAIGIRPADEDDMAKAGMQPAGSVRSMDGQGGPGKMNTLSLPNSFGQSGPAQSGFQQQQDPLGRSPMGPGISAPATIGLSMGQSPRDLDPGVTRGSTLGQKSPGLSKSPNSPAARLDDEEQDESADWLDQLGGDED